MLMDLEQEVLDIFITVSHAEQPFYLVVDTFRDSSSDFKDEVVEDIVSFSKKPVLRMQVFEFNFFTKEP